MAKHGLNWFRIDVSFDDKFELVCAEYGSVAFEVIVRLWQKIYEQGYYCEWNTEVALLFAKRLSLGGNVVSEIINCCIRRNLFDAEKYTKYGILTSKGIQQWYIDSTVKRVNVEVIEEYLTINIDNLSKNVIRISKNDGRNAKNAGRNRHSTDSTDSTGSTDSIYDVASAPTPTTRTKRCIPTLVDVQAYCKERQNNLNAEKFVDFYTAKGWMVGKAPMKDWKACVRTWEQNSQGSGNYSQNSKSPKFNLERNYNKEQLDAILGVDNFDF